LDNGLTETGPSPTGISTSNVGLAAVLTLNTDNELFAVLTANKRVPSDESRIGLVCEGSKLAGAGEADCAGAASDVSMTAKDVAPMSARFDGDSIFPPTCVFPSCLVHDRTAPPAAPV
jgi:hypothetical protein